MQAILTLTEIKLTASDPYNTHLSLPGCIYDALYETTIKLSADAKTIKSAQRLSDLARLVAHLTFEYMTPPEQHHLTERAGNNIAPYANYEETKITDAMKKDLAWISSRFGPVPGLKSLPPRTKELPMPQ